MARRKKITKTKKINKKKLFEDITKAEPKDFCYFIDYVRKIHWGEIQKVMTENNQLLFQIMDERESRYYIVLASKCSFDENKIKEMKREK
jgi:hypothetical protein